MDQEILKKITQNQNTVLVYKGQNYQYEIINIHQALSTVFQNTLTITINYPTTTLIKKLQQKGINTNNYHFIDAVTTKGTTSKETKQTTYISSPTALTELAIAINKTIQTTKPQLMILDNISTMIMYNKAVVVAKFLHSIMTKIRKTDTKAIYPILKKDMEGTMLELQMFADTIIEL